MRARIEWRRGDEFGLSFLDAACATGAALESGDLMGRIAHLEVELALLQQMVKQLKGGRYYAEQIRARSR
jgi:hypothetical protein